MVARKIPSRKEEFIMAVILFPILIPSRFRIKMANKNPPPNIPGINAELNSHNIITIKERYQFSSLSVSALTRTIYAKSRMKIETTARSIHKVELVVQEILVNALGLNSLKNNHTATPKASKIGRTILPAENCFRILRGSFSIIFFGWLLRSSFRRTNYKIVKPFADKD